jgi:hypothetical protein
MPHRFNLRNGGFYFFLILARVADYGLGKPLPIGEITFRDCDNVYSLEAIQRVRGGDIMSGLNATTFNPTGSFTREQSITTMLKLWEWYTK